ncbi:50S ribosomal protein L11 methyltransferase [Neisseria sp. ZJ106]|uniref:Ribosomal protein L11 methyltransferase n=1 Tax=Neisseria lisongii TaxID=2912188 RepID=A0AAW5AQJ1_9NEIS|nr:50S ribosomal protein L11 methyltransferase [Neisseria lisongii]MCF7522209.1 50S ribosomal protein L11 methyltransferase [Neisseria lisongii]MCF7530462.1 50S ribosomal protein L11 methyltransferase [Neisseria lisongii]WCL70945.1 50S ribosomal protein L11 methyltransferase [Neisseria lisongii]
MSYQQITIPVNDTVAERLADALMEHGALSAAIEDAYAGTENEQAIFGEPGMPTEQIWQQSKVIALFGGEDDAAAIVRQAAAACGLGELPCHSEILEEQDWVRLTQAQFDPIQISDRLWITPSWHEVPDADAVNLQLDPGLAFGTGSHPTTRLCLQWLDNELKGGESVLDYGCGSGILAIAALKLGAGSAVGVDIDEQAIRASNDNAAQNNVAAQFHLPDSLPEGQFDVVVANILANPLRMLGEMLANRTKTGGRIVLSGLLDEQITELSDIYAQWFDMQPAQTEDGWARLSGIKR